MSKFKKPAIAFGGGTVDVPELARQFDRAPTASDTNFEQGFTWIYANGDNRTVYIFGGVDSSGDAVYALASPGDSDVDTLTGDSGGAISPTTGNITLAGGNSITSSGAGSTITFALDAAITASTSVTTPLVVPGAGNDFQITAATGQNIILKMGDNAGANKVSFIDSDDSEVYAIDSNGTVSFTAVTVTDLTATGTAQDIGNSNSATTIQLGKGTGGNTLSLNAGVNTVANVTNINSGAAAANSTVNVLSGNATAGTQTLNVLTGNRAGALNLATGSAAHVIAVGSASAGAITVDTSAGISLDGATASNFTVTGAGQDLTLSSAGGSVKVDSTEDAAGAIALTANGGTSETIVLTASQGTGADSVQLDSTAGGITLSAALASADAINLAASAGGVDIDGALQINVDSSQAAADALRLAASNAAGGIDMDCGTGGAALDSTGGISLDGATASNFTVTGATEDLTLSSVGGSVKVSATEDAAGAIALTANGGTSETITVTASQGTGAASVELVSTAGGVTLTAGLASDDAINLSAASGGVDIDGALQVNIASSENTADAISINSSAGGMDLVAAGAAGEDIDITCTAGSVNITAGESAADAMVLDASGSAGAIQLKSGTGGVVFDSGMTVNVTTVNNAASPYTVLGSDYVLATDTSAGVVTLTLPGSPATGRMIRVVDSGGSATGSNITVDGNGNNIAAGGTTAATKPIDSNYGTMTLVFTGSIWNAMDVA